MEQAKKHGDHLIVVVARDRNVKKLKGKWPREKEKIRWQKVKNLSFVDEVVLGQLKNKFKIIKKYKPAVICLGYDQAVDIHKLKKVFSGRIVRLKPYKERIYKSSKL